MNLLMYLKITDSLFLSSQRTQTIYSNRTYRLLWKHKGREQDEDCRNVQSSKFKNR